MKNTTKTVKNIETDTSKNIKVGHIVDLDLYSRYVVIGVKQNDGKLNVLTPHIQNVVNSVGLIEVGKQLVLNKKLE